MKETNCNLPSWVDPNCDIIEIVQDTVESCAVSARSPIVSLGGTDARLWRYRNIPTCVYGPFPHGMGSYDEHVDVEEYLHIVRTHVLAAYAYLSRDSTARPASIPDRLPARGPGGAPA